MELLMPLAADDAEAKKEKKAEKEEIIIQVKNKVQKESRLILIKKVRRTLLKRLKWQVATEASEEDKGTTIPRKRNDEKGYKSWFNYCLYYVVLPLCLGII